ncbi:hypothetical protein BN1723_009344 [Verticillium longisporum]|uniref:Uncharacterized protein n=1 Tax=Verticillium longisporum TaxID=100787 RepID=A0A0G4KNC7_VERLO|nr:hypothetical protein BN1723_009344 [Verticillium longisporum]
MSSRILAASARAVPRTVPAVRAARTFQTSATLRDAVATPLPARKPVGAFRGGLLGFFAGSSLAGAGVYSYLVKEYKLSNELLTEDIYPKSTTWEGRPGRMGIGPCVTVGAFRGGYVLSTSLSPCPSASPPWHEYKLTVVLSLARSLLGFFAGSSLAGAGVYSYLVKEYKLSNELLTEDIYALQAAVQRVTVYVQTLEEKMDALERKRK